MYTTGLLAALSLLFQGLPSLAYPHEDGIDLAKRFPEERSLKPGGEPIILGRDLHRFKEQDNDTLLQSLYEGNLQWRSAPGEQELLKSVAEVQAPRSVFLGCADSRVSEGTIFGNMKPGTLFTHRNIANQFHESDTNAHSFVSYAIGHLGPQHIIVMGHYGCGGIAAAIASPPPVGHWQERSIQKWIGPIRTLYQTSNRSEIVALRNKNKGLAHVDAPPANNTGYRALVEENVKATVKNIVSSSIMREMYHKRARDTSNEEPHQDVFIHGLVYNLENVDIRDLGVSVGPPGKPLPAMPFPRV